jgi:hypothetical protein
MGMSRGKLQRALDRGKITQEGWAARMIKLEDRQERHRRDQEKLRHMTKRGRRASHRKRRAANERRRAAAAAPMPGRVAEQERQNQEGLQARLAAMTPAQLADYEDLERRKRLNRQARRITGDVQLRYVDEAFRRWEDAGCPEIDVIFQEMRNDGIKRLGERGVKRILKRGGSPYQLAGLPETNLDGKREELARELLMATRCIFTGNFCRLRLNADHIGRDQFD